MRVGPPESIRSGRDEKHEWIALKEHLTMIKFMEPWDAGWVWSNRSGREQPREVCTMRQHLVILVIALIVPLAALAALGEAPAPTDAAPAPRYVRIGHYQDRKSTRVDNRSVPP